MRNEKTGREPCSQCGMRIRRNQPWHEKRHYFSQAAGKVRYEIYNHEKKQNEWKWA